MPADNFQTDLEVYHAALGDVRRILEPSIDEARQRLHASGAYGAVTADYDAAQHDSTLLTDFAEQVLPVAEQADGFLPLDGYIHTATPFVAKVALSRMLYGRLDGSASYRTAATNPYFIVGAHASGKHTSLLLTTPLIKEPPRYNDPRAETYLLSGVCRTKQFEEWQDYSNEVLINDLSEDTLRDMLDFDTGTYNPSKAKGVVIGTNFRRLPIPNTRESLIKHGLHFDGPLTQLTKKDLPAIDIQKHDVIKHLTGLAIDFGKTDVLSGLLKARAEAGQ